MTFALASLTASVSGSTVSASTSARSTDGNARDVDYFEIVAASPALTVVLAQKTQVDFWNGTNVSLSGSKSLPAGTYSVQTRVREGSTTTNIGAPKTVTVGSVTPPPPDGGTGTLEFAPPVLTSPYIFDVPVTGADVKFPSGRDVLVRMPKTPLTGGLKMYGGHHVVIQGGAIHSSSRALVFQGHTGDAYAEGLEIGKPDGSTTEGVNWNNLHNVGQRRVLQNMRFNALSGSRDTNHSDGAQDWSGAAGGTSIFARIYAPKVTYQWMMWQPEANGDTMKALVLRDLVLAHEAGKGGYLLYYTGSTPRDWQRVHLYTDNVAGNAVYPKSLYPGNGIDVHSLASLSSAPSVLVGTPGVNYVSPNPVKVV